jgi:hypothetical protein
VEEESVVVLICRISFGIFDYRAEETVFGVSLSYGFQDFVIEFEDRDRINRWVLDIRISGQSVSSRVGDTWDVVYISIKARQIFVPTDLPGREIFLRLPVSERCVVRECFKS